MRVKVSLLSLIAASTLTLSIATATIGAESSSAHQSWQTALSEGKTYLAEQRLDKAEESFRVAYQLVKTQSKKQSEIDTCLRSLADTLTLRDKTGEAQGLYLNLLASLSKRFGNNSPKLEKVLLTLGSIQEAEGDHTTAMSYYQRVLKMNEKNYGPYSPGVAQTLHKMARVSQHAGNRAESEKHYKQAMSILVQEPGLQASSEMEKLMHNYTDLIKGNDTSNQDLLNDFKTEIYGNANSSTSDGTTDSTINSDRKQTPSSLPQSNSTQDTSSISGLPRIAVPSANDNAMTSSPSKQSAWQMQNASSATSQRAGETNADPAVVLRGLERPSSVQTLDPAYKVINNSLFNQSHYSKGVDSYERMIAADINALGPNHPTVANDLTGLGQLYLAQNKYAQAEQVLNRALPIYVKAYGETNILTINATAALASAEFHLGKIDKASEHYRKALANGQSTLGPNSLEVARILNELAYLNYNQGKLAEAKTLYEWAVSSTQAAVGENSLLFAACLKDYAQVLRSLGDFGPAATAESRAEKILAAAKTN